MEDIVLGGQPQFFWSAPRDTKGGIENSLDCQRERSPRKRKPVEKKLIEKVGGTKLQSEPAPKAEEEMIKK